MRRTLIAAYLQEAKRFPNVDRAQANYLWHLMKDRERRHAIKKLEEFDRPFLVEERHDPG